jgi:hypothetical protein
MVSYERGLCTAYEGFISRSNTQYWQRTLWTEYTLVFSGLLALYGTIFPVPSPESVLGKVNCNHYVLKNIVNNNFMHQNVLNPNAY